MSKLIITKIEMQKKDESRLSVYINGKFSFGISKRDAEEYKLAEDIELSESFYKTIIDDLVLKRAKFFALKYLSYCSRTEREIEKKLLSYDEFSEKTITEVTEYLKRLGYINDEEYAKTFFASKSRRNLDGSYKIKYKLKEKGINADVSAEDLGIDEVSNAVRLIKKKYPDFLNREFGDKNEKYKYMKKIYGYMSRKGYPASVIKKALEEQDAQDDFDFEDF